MNTLTEKERKAVEEFATDATSTEFIIISNSLNESIQAYNDGKRIGIQLGAEFLAELRKEEAPSESTNASEVSNQLCDKYSLTIDYTPILEEAYELGQIRANCNVNEELLDALESLYESLPDGYTHESVLKAKAILHPIYAERNHSRCNDIKNDEF